MIVKELDIIKLADGRNATVLEVFNRGAAYLVEVADKAGKMLDMPTIAPEDIAEVIWSS